MCICFFQDVNVDLFQPSVQSMSICTRLYLQFYTVLFETLHVLLSWPEDMNVPRTKFSD